MFRPTASGVGRAREPVWMVLVWLAGAAVFFRGQWTSSFTKLQGNDGDTRLEAYLCEHWFRVLHGQDSWQNPIFFHPVKDLLGWSDGFVLYQVFYAPLRLLGCDPFVALQVTVILLSLVGFVSFVVFVRTAFGAGRVVAGIGGLIFTFANTLFLHAGFDQLNGVYIVPLILVVGLQSWRAATARPIRSVVLGALFGVLWALLFFTTYYVAWFSTLAAGIVVALLFVAGPRRFVDQARSALQRIWRPAAVGVVAFGLGIIPFLMTYLPARHQAPGASYALALSYAGRLHDLINVGSGNIWSRLIPHVLPSVNLGAYEKTYAVTPLVVLMALAGGGFAAWRTITRTAARPVAARAATVLVATTIVFALLPLDTRFGTPWAIIYHLPGASAMRAIFRLEVVTGLLATMTIVAAATEVSGALVARPRATTLRVAGVALLLLGLVEQINTTQVSQINNHTQLELLRSVIPPPSTCRSFYVIDSANPTLPFYEAQIDAMLISQKLSLPTINGYTGYNPRGWDLEQIGASDYQDNVANWAVGHGVSSGLCELDLAGMKWHQNPLLTINSEEG